MPKSELLQAPGSFLTLMLEKYNLAPFRLSKEIHLSQSAVRLLVLGKNRITVPVALRLAKYFNTSPEFWLIMQVKWEIAQAEKDKDLMKIVKSISRMKTGSAPKKKSAGAKKSATGSRAAVRRVTKPKKPTAVKKPAPVKKTVRKAAKKRATAK